MRKIIPLIIVLGICLIFLPQAWADLEEGLMAYYPFNGNADDESGNGNHGTVLGATLTVGRFGNANSAYIFDGVDDLIEVPDNSAFHFTNKITIAAWIKPFEIFGGWGGRTIVNKWYAPDVFNFIIVNGDIRFWIQPIAQEWKWVDAPITANNWTHVTGAFNGESISIFINGQRIASKTVSGILKNSDRPISIGNHPSWDPYSGVIDDIRIYDRALSEDEIKMLSRIQNPDNGHWYHRFDNAMTWHDAKAHCESMDGYLATVTSEQENRFIYDNLVDPIDHMCWLGGTDEVNEGTWQWITGEAWEYSNWDNREPNDACNGEDYLHIYDYRVKWNDMDNDGYCGGFGLMYPICEWEEFDNQPPEAICHDATVPTEPGLCTAGVSVDDGSFDPDGDEITLEQTPPGPYDLGDTDVALTVTDDKNVSDTCEGTVTVIDDEAPVISSVTANPKKLWPPNHKMVPVTVSVDASDNCDLSCQINSVASNEPVNGSGDGDTAPDRIITGGLTVKLRAERSGKGNGRVYTITVECTDQSGNSSTDTATLRVLHDKGKKNKGRPLFP